ncbi:MAG: hypothetical protein KJ747_02205 [Actinobacteria bacterium]|nr:hypothetical protein [Actinomycetota bacterium]MCG2808360.1 hypothetical protein [Coriobacteriia bacterium]
MQFVITCPVDGPIEVSVEDIDTVVLREPEQAEVVFSCPECGAEISVVVRIPSFLMAAIEAMASDTDSYVAPLASLVAMAAQAEAARDEAEPVVIPPAHLEQEDHDRIDCYCEYFRRQLALVDDVQDALRELGAERE